MRICAVTCVHQQRRLLEATMRHLLLNGIDDFFVYDHLSDPPVGDWLPSALSATSARVRIVRKGTTPMHQRAMMTLLTETARSEGFDAALALDADEFWCSIVPGRTLAECIEDELPARTAAVRVPFLTYAQHRDVMRFTVGTLSSCRFRVVPCDVLERSQRELVEAGAPFVAMPFESKAIIRLDEGVHYSEGQHDALSRDGAATMAESRRIVVRHLTLPSRATLVGKREHGRRRVAGGHHGDIGWQVQRLAGMTDDELDAYWACNSWHEEPDGRVLVGDYDAVVPDDALVEIGRRLEAAFPPTETAAGASAGSDGAATVPPGAIDALVDELGEALVREARLTESLDEARRAVEAGDAAIAGLRSALAGLQTEFENRRVSRVLRRALLRRPGQGPRV